jgi:glucose-6-phosphate isomerase
MQQLYPGKLAQAWRRERDNLVTGKAVDRLWGKDATLWQGPQGQRQSVGGNLAWLDLPEQIGPYIERVRELMAAPGREAFQDVVFIAMGDSNLAAQALLQTAAEKRFRRVFLLDSADPNAIRTVEEQLDFEATVFVVASKFGKRIETHALMLYFLDRLKTRSLGDPGRCFVAVTEKDSYLAELAHNYGFLGTFFDTPGIKGRYSSLIHFGLLQSTIWNSEPEDLVSRAVAMRDLCRQPDGDQNPALGLAAFLAAGALEGDDKLVLVGTRSVGALTYRIGQLVGASLDKEGQGFIPICDASPTWLEVYRRGCTAAVLTMRGDENTEVKEFETQLRRAAVPTVSVDMASPEEFGAEMFKWEIATALACAPLNVNPFDEPDVEQRRSTVSAMLEEVSSKRAWPARTARVREKGIELYAGAETRQQISTLNLSQALRTFFEAKEPDGYVSTIVFAGNHPATDSVLRQLREHLTSRLGIPVLLNLGPRYLLTFEQVYKGGPSTGLFLILTSEPGEDIGIPGAGYTFGQLQLALALSDFESLELRRMRVVQLHCTQGLERGLSELENLVRKL